MGARQRAQKRGKAPKGSQKGTPTSQKKLNSSIHVHDLNPATRSSALLGWQDFALAGSPSGRQGFTMGDAARNTERHVSGWGPTKYRDQAISFVSAGNLHQDPEHTNIPAETPQGSDSTTEEEVDEEDEDEQEAGEEERAEEVEDQGIVHQGSFNAQSSRTLAENITAPQSTPSKREEASAPTVKNSNLPIRPRAISPSSSSASDTEQIVFTGRSKGLTPNLNSAAASKKNSRTHSPMIPSSNKDQPKTDIPVTKPIPVAVATKPEPNVVQPEASSSDRRVSSSRLHRRGRDRRRQYEIDEQEALMRDYIANMAMDDTEESDEQPQQENRKKNRRNETIRFYDGSGEENAKVQVQATKSVFSQQDFDQAMDWNSDDLQDFDDISTTDDEVAEISQVLRHRERETGVQYLVTPHGHSASDSKWVPHAKLISESARREVAIFEEILAMEFESDSSENDDEDDDDDDDDETTDEEVEEALNDLVDHIESEDDENARILKHTARMSDEQIARALAKQEELGMGGDEVMLFSGEVEEEDEIDMDDVFGRNDDFVSFSIKTHTSNRTRSKRNKKNRDSFPSAAAFADALDEDPYGGFDVMDFDRPSLRPKKKGRKSDFPYDLELEDEELRDQLVSTWTKDRDKKVQRKRDKEEARQAALLEVGNRGEPAAIKAEIRRFLMQEADTLRLVPMDSSTRASVHRLAKALRLNSRSEGKDGIGIGRYPVLSKTIRTPSYSIDTIWQIDALLNTKKFFPKNAGSYKKEKTTRAVAGRAARMRQSGGVQGASYMNGEIVGASAPEIGVENKGRALLEKMGWTSGMAIGAEGNKGSLEAVKHVFKTSRAGLG